ncbi:MAG: hypothetical protein JF612_12355, partial [Planctomycetia bacterium]|nr:hypothetical protein [Planctomycetia bacterium]
HATSNQAYDHPQAQPTHRAAAGDKCDAKHPGLPLLPRGVRKKGEARGSKGNSNERDFTQQVSQ